jgi:uncharacterized protein YkwD
VIYGTLDSRRGRLYMRQAVVLLMALAFGIFAAVSVSAVQPREAEAASVKVKGCTGTKVSLSNAEKAMLDLHNQKRADRKLPKLCIHPALQRAAEAHSRDMMSRDYFAHDSKGSGTTFAQRLTRAGYRYRTAGENIAWGSGPYAGPSNRMTAWMKSPGHRVNILNGKFREVGIAAVSGTYKQYDGATMWTADFGTR